MAYVDVPKDLKKVKTTVIGNLTIKQTIGMVVAVILTAVMIYYLHKPLGYDMAAIVGLIPAVGIMMLTMNDTYGRRFLLRWEKQNQPQHRSYISVMSKKKYKEVKKQHETKE